MGLINILHKIYPEAILAAVSVFGANQFPEMKLEYDQSNNLGNNFFAGLVPTFYLDIKKWKKAELLFERLSYCCERISAQIFFMNSSCSSFFSSTLS